MDIVKKNILNILCGVVALVALVLWFWPLGAWKAEAQQKLSARVAMNGQMQSIKNQTRNLPDVSLNGSANRTLDMFPTRRVIEWAGGLKQKLAEEGQAVKKYAVSLSVRPVLLDGVLPVPQPTKDYEFREVYFKAVQALPAKKHMGPPPTQDDIDNAMDDLWKGQYDNRVVKRDGVADPASLQEQQEAFNKEAKLVPERVKQQHAKSLICYIDPATIVPDAAIGAVSSGSAPTPSSIWYAQMHYWVQGDVLDAIEKANQRASKMKCVMDAPVKYIRRLSISEYRADMQAVTEGTAGGPDAQGMGGGGGLMMGMGRMMGAGPGGPGGRMGPGGPGGGGGPGGPGGGGGPGGPGGAMGPGGGRLGADSLTGRKSNALYDVIPVELVLDVEAERLPYVLAQLGNDGFITPYEVSVTSLDSVLTSLQENVAYGSAPVVRASILCELLMFRDWTVPLMPTPIKQALGVEGSSAAAAAPAGM